MLPNELNKRFRNEQWPAWRGALLSMALLAVLPFSARAFDSPSSDGTQYLRGEFNAGGVAYATESADNDELTGSFEAIESVLPYQDGSGNFHQSGLHTTLYYPQSPVGFFVSGVSSVSVTTNWTAPAGGVHYNEDVSAYEIRFSSTVGSMSSFTDFRNATSHGLIANLFGAGDAHPPELLNGLEYDAQYFVGIVAHDTQQTVGNPRNGSLLTSFSTYTLCGRPTITLASGSNATEKVTVTFNGSNPLGKTIFYEVQISESNLFPGAGAHTFTTSTTTNNTGNIVYLINDARNRTLTQYMRVRARNPGTNNWSPYSNVFNYDFTNGSAVLNPILSSDITPTQVALSWSGDDDNQYKPQYSLDIAFSVPVSGPKQLGSTTKSYTATPLAENTTYYFRVITYNFSGVTTIATSAVTSAMTGVSFPSTAMNSIYISSATMDVSESSVLNSHSYKIELSSNGFVSIATQTVLDFGPLAEANTATLGNLVGNTTYYSRVTSINNIGWISPTTNPGPTFITRPSSVPFLNPVTLTPTDSETQVKFTWGLGNNTQANTQFKVVLSSASDFSLNASTAIVGPNVFEVLFTTNNFLPLISNNTYYAKVEVMDADLARASLSAAVTASTVTKPIQPQNFQYVSISSGNIAISWELSGPGGVNASNTQYDAFQGTPMDPLHNKIGGNIVNANFTYESHGLTPNTTYTLTVIAKANGGWANETVTDTTVTWARRPLISFNSASTDTLTFQTSLFLTGAQNPVGSLCTYECFLSTDVGFLNVQASSTTSNVFATLSGLQAGALYRARAYITDHAGRTTFFSALTNGYTFANPPQLVDFTVGDLSTGTVTVNWTHNGNNSDSTYRIYVDSVSIRSIGGTTYTHPFPSGGAFDKTVPNSTHSFRVETELLPGNFFQVSAPSAIISTSTLANVPLAALPSRTLSATRVQFKILNLNNPDETEFAILLRSTDAVFANYFNTVIETPLIPAIERMAIPDSAVAVWRKLSAWAKPLGGSTYTFTADNLPVDGKDRELLLKARNRYGIETGWSIVLPVSLQSGYPEVTLVLPSLEIVPATTSYAAPIYTNQSAMDFRALGSGHFNAIASEDFPIAPAEALNSGSLDYYQSWSGWNGEQSIGGYPAKFKDPPPLYAGAWNLYDFQTEGLWYLNIAGDLTDLGDFTNTFISTSPFRVYVDTTPVDPGTIRAEFGQDATGTPDHTEILPGLPTGHQKPEFFWTKLDTQGKPNPRSPIVGWSWSFSSNPVITPQLSTAQPQFLPASLFVAASSASYRVFMATYVPNFDLVFESTFYFKVAALDQAGNWTLTPSEFQYNYVKDQVPPDLIGFDFPGVEVWTSSPTRYEAVNSTVPVQVIFSELMNFVGGDQAMSIVQTQDHLGNPMGTTIPYTVAWVELPTGTSAVITPSLPGNQWPTGSRFVLHIDGFFTRDLAGNRLNANFDVLFNTAMDPAVVNIGKSEDGNTTVTFQPGAFGANPAGAAIADNPATRPVSAAPGLAGTVRKAVETIVKTKGGDYRKILSIKQFELYDLNRRALKTPFSGQVLLTFQYHDVNDNGIVDETEAKFPVKVKDLAIHWLDEKSGAWIKLPESVVDTAVKTVSIPLQHFSVYALIGAPSLDLSNAHPFPVPYKASSDPAGITFTGLSSIATVKIFTLDGRLVKTLTDDSGAGFVRWDPVNNESGTPVASDVYLYVIENDQQRRIGKLMVIR